ncbi:MAG: cell division protein FtsA, partial [Deltaproteobacteria bacterium]
MAGCEITSVHAGISGTHLKGFNSPGIVTIRHGVVRETDVRRAQEQARAVDIQNDRRLIHVLPSEFVIDRHEGVKDPVGMRGVRLEVNCHIITALKTLTDNIIKCANEAGLHVTNVVPASLASSEAVLSEDEKELGVALVDIGGGTTDIAIFVEGSIKHSAVIPIGGANITSDIAIGLRTPPQPSAEHIKTMYGCALSALIEEDTEIEVQIVGGHRPTFVSQRFLVERIIEPRIQEIFEQIYHTLVSSGYQELIASGIVLTGGAVNMPGMLEAAERFLDIPVRLGIPYGMGGLTNIVQSPIYAAGVGLVIHANRLRKHPAFKLRDEHLLGRFMKRFQDWLGDFL